MPTPNSSSSTSSVLVTGTAPSRSSPLVPRATVEVTWPGTAATQRPRSRAKSLVIRLPLGSAASTTTVMRARPAMIRLRAGKLQRSGWVPGGSSDSTSPLSRTCSMQEPVPTWIDHVGSARQHRQGASRGPRGSPGARWRRCRARARSPRSRRPPRGRAQANAPPRCRRDSAGACRRWPPPARRRSAPARTAGRARRSRRAGRRARAGRKARLELWRHRVRTPRSVSLLAHRVGVEALELERDLLGALARPPRSAARARTGPAPRARAGRSDRAFRRSAGRAGRSGTRGAGSPRTRGREATPWRVTRPSAPRASRR